MSDKVNSRAAKKAVAVHRAPAATGPSPNVHSIWGFLLLFGALSTPVFMMSWQSRAEPTEVEVELAKAPYDLQGLDVSCGVPSGLQRKCHIKPAGALFYDEMSMPHSAESFPGDYFVYRLGSGAIRVKTNLNPEHVDLSAAKLRLLEEVNDTAAEYLKRKQGLTAAARPGS